jgi:hypothetical protein
MSRAAATLALVVSVAAPVCAGLFKVWVFQDAVQFGYLLSEQEQSRRRLGNSQRQLEIELAAERSPAQLLKIAKRLELAPPAAHQLLMPGGGDHGRP